MREYYRQYRAKHREKIKGYNAMYYYLNKTRLKAKYLDRYYATKATTAATIPC